MHRLALILAVLLPWPAPAQTFEVPGHQETLEPLESLLHLHRVLGPDTTLWDPWLPMSVLGWQTDRDPGTASLRAAYRERLLRRRIDPEGYVSTQQHEGLAHSEGWPFPLWTQAGGQGWHFTTRGVPYGPEHAVHTAGSVDDWTLHGLVHERLDPASGWTLRAAPDDAHPVATLTSPPFRIEALVAPFVRLKWSMRGFGPDLFATLHWLREGDPDFSPDRSLALPLPEADDAVTDVNLPLHRSPGWGGHLVRFQLRFTHLQPGAELTLLRLFTAIDSRHNINNAAYLQACDDYLRWTGDLDFLRRNLQRMRLALAWAIHEFQLADRHLVVTPWIGHDGRSGHRLEPGGKRTLLPGVGVGNNYWDLLPFGGEDALATIYYFDAIRRMAALERQIERHPEWNLPAGPLSFTAAELLELANEIRTAGNQRFWNPATGRFFGWRDTLGNGHDYGFTFVNNEAIYYGFAEPAHARSIRDWIDGRRLVPGDTSTGPDIYHWRFGPRATTRRNIETYLWAWSDPASIPWGGQVQDGGSVLGFSFHDLMARLQLNGPDDAWNRLRHILDWFTEVQRAGGYRAYYADRQRGTLQGGGTAGGLGLDHEFFESALVPQVMLYGFLGFRPRLDGCLIAPRLPAAWPSLTVRGIRLHNVTLDVTAEPRRLRVQVHGVPLRPLRLFTPGGDDAEVAIREGVIEIATPL
ncbi:MAG: hypothetical protein KF833_10655 [Verrucomicrobiae bacterium]|nr:hypothetical protein [Verrucomicrobiae bacterium]